MSLESITDELSALLRKFQEVSKEIEQRKQLCAEDYQCCEDIKGKFETLYRDIAAFQQRALQAPPALTHITFKEALTGDVLYTVCDVQLPCSIMNVFRKDVFGSLPTSCIRFAEGVHELKNITVGPQHEIQVVKLTPSLHDFLTVGECTKQRRWHKEGLILSEYTSDLKHGVLSQEEEVLKLTPCEMFRFFFQSSLFRIRQQIAMEMPRENRGAVGAVHALVNLHIQRCNGRTSLTAHERKRVQRLVSQAMDKWHVDNKDFKSSVLQALKDAGGIGYFR